MATEIFYADLAVGPGERCGKRRSLPEPGSPDCPRWHRVALGASWTGNLLLGVAVVALGCSFLHLQPESPGSGKIGNGNIEDRNSTRENELLELRGVLRELREVLCPSQSPGAQGCRICPQGWTMNGTECYWVSTEHGPWSKSREDCGDRGATLLLPWDRDELKLLDETLQKSGRNFWIGLWVPAAGKGWTWVNGSRLDRDRFQLDHTEKPGTCGTIKGNKIIPHECGVEWQWICQRKATEL